MTQQVLDRALTHEAHAAEDLQAAIDDGVGLLGRVVLGDGGIAHDRQRIAFGVHPPREVVDEPAHRFDIDLAAGKREGDSLIARERLPEGRARLGMVDCRIEGPLGQAKRMRPDVGAARIEEGHGLEEAHADLADDMVGRHARPVEEQLRGVPVRQIPLKLAAAELI